MGLKDNTPAHNEYCPTSCWVRKTSALHCADSLGLLSLLKKECNTNGQGRACWKSRAPRPTCFKSYLRHPSTAPGEDVSLTDLHTLATSSLQALAARV